MSSPIDLKIHFDGACVFFHHNEGSDVWFPIDTNHVPVLSGKGLASFAAGSGFQEFNLTGWTVHIVHGRTRQPISTGKVAPPTKDLIPFIDELMPDSPFAEGLPDVPIGQVPMCLATHVRLSTGKLTAGQPDATKPYATAVWTFEVASGPPRYQSLISTSTYETHGLAGPVRFVLRRGTDEQWFEPTIDSGACEVGIEMRDTKDSQAIREPEKSGLAFLDEFRLLTRCFANPTLDVPHTKAEPPNQAHVGPINSQEALCPEGQAGGHP